MASIYHIPVLTSTPYLCFYNLSWNACLLCFMYICTFNNLYNFQWSSITLFHTSIFIEICKWEFFFLSFRIPAFSYHPTYHPYYLPWMAIYCIVNPLKYFTCYITECLFMFISHGINNKHQLLRLNRDILPYIIV